VIKSKQNSIDCTFHTAAQVTDEYVTHYNRHRPDRARNLRSPGHDDNCVAPVADLAATRIRRRKVPGGLIHEYGALRDHRLCQSRRQRPPGHDDPAVVPLAVPARRCKVLGGVINECRMTA